MSDKTSISQMLTGVIKQQLQDVPVSHKPKNEKPFRKAVIRGLGVLLPPLLTIVIFFWVWGTVATYVINPVYNGTIYLLLRNTDDIVMEKNLPLKDRNKETVYVPEKKAQYNKVGDGTYVPQYIWDKVLEKSTIKDPMPRTGLEIYRRYIEIKYLNPFIFIPISILILVLLLYLIGKFIAIEIGRFFWSGFEILVNRVPLVSNVYGAVKQVSDFMFAEREFNYSRVVAIEWPRKGIWALTLVTSEGIPAMEKYIGEPVYAVLVPTSPMPLTGFTLTVKQSEAVDLDISIDQAIQFIVSCGVVTCCQQIENKDESEGESQNEPA